MFRLRAGSVRTCSAGVDHALELHHVLVVLDHKELRCVLAQFAEASFAVVRVGKWSVCLDCNFDACWRSPVGSIPRLAEKNTSHQTCFGGEDLKPVRVPGGRPLHRRKQRRGDAARLAARTETWTCGVRHGRCDRQSPSTGTRLVSNGKRAPFESLHLGLPGLHVRCATVVLCVPTCEKVKGTGRSSSARHVEVCRSERY